MLVAIEFGWHKFPSTQESSMGLTFANLLIAVGVYYGHPTGFGGRIAAAPARAGAVAKKKKQ